VRFYRRVRTLPFAPYESLIGSPENTAADTLGMLEGGYTRELSSRLTATVRGYASAYRYRDRLVLADGTAARSPTSATRGGPGPRPAAATRCSTAIASASPPAPR
jgi:hypothetical protein